MRRGPMRTAAAAVGLGALLLLTAALAAPGGPAAQGGQQGAGTKQGSRARGLKVTYEPLDPEQRGREGVHSYRADFLALAVERGETPTPLLSPGLFAATFRGIVELNLRERFRFRLDGKGRCKMTVNGEAVLDGTMRPGRPLETDQALRLQKGDNEIEVRVESSVVGDVQLRLLWSGTDFAFEPIAPERWAWAADDGEIAAGERLRRGHQLFVERRCVRCHALESPPGETAFGELDQPGPDLRDAGARLHAGWIAEWLRDPRAVIPDARMPRLRVERESDPADVAAWLATMGGPLPAKAAPAGAAPTGAVRFRELGCIACHTPPGASVPPEELLDRISLDFVARKWRFAALEHYLLAPREGRSHARMPDFRLDAADATALAAYLIGDAQPPEVPPGDPERGRRIAQEQGCDRCHALQQAPGVGRHFRDLRALHAGHGCLGGSADAPDFGFDAAEREALQAFLPHAQDAVRRRSPLDYAARAVPALRCRNCHGFAAEPSVWARLSAAWSRDAPLPPEQDPVAQGLPALTWVGDKLQPSWMERFVTGREPSPRPWLHARMPSFPARGAVTVAGLVRAHGHSGKDEPEAAPDAQLAIHGQRLVKMGEGFGCVQCHGVGEQPPVQVFEREGVNFDVAAQRLRRDYYMRWLLDPPRIDPDSRMPKYADAKGRTAFTDVLGGNAEKQFDAIWHWFRTLR